MANILDERGLFWFKEGCGNTASLETSIPGTLTISEEGHINLQLEGSLWYESPKVGFDWGEWRWLPDEKRIAGRLGDDGDRGYVLLSSLLRTDLSLEDDKPIRQSYKASLCFKNDFAFSLDFDPESFHELRIELEGLEEWLQLNSINVGCEFRDGDHTEFKISYKNHKFEYKTPMATVSIENLILGISPIRLFDRLDAEVNIRQTNWLVYTPAKQSTLIELRAAFLRIEELIALLVGQYFRLDWPNFVGRNGEIETWYKLYFFRGPKGEKLPYSFFLWTTFGALHGAFGDLLDRWQTNVAKYGAGYELYIASMQKPLLHPEHEFVNLVWAIESVHRTWQREGDESAHVVNGMTKIEHVLKRFSEPDDKQLRQWLRGKLKYAYEPTLEERIYEAFKRLPFGIDSGQLRSFAMRCAKRRNDISHEGGRRPGEDLEIFRTDIRELAEALRYLFHALLLLEIGIGSDILRKVITRSPLGQTRILPCLRDVQIDLPTSDSAR